MAMAIGALLFTLLAPSMALQPGEPPSSPRGAASVDTRPMVCSSPTGTVIITSTGDTPMINIPSTLWPKKGDGWYQMVNLTDEPTVVRGKIDLGRAKASFSLDKYTLRLVIYKSPGEIVPLARSLYVTADCARREI